MEPGHDPALGQPTLMVYGTADRAARRKAMHESELRHNLRLRDQRSREAQPATATTDLDRVPIGVPDRPFRSAVGWPCPFTVEDAGGEAAVSSSQPPSPC